MYKNYSLFQELLKLIYDTDNQYICIIGNTSKKFQINKENIGA